MLKRAITYKDFNEVEQTDICYFNISKVELVEMDVEQKQGFDEWIQMIIETKDRKTLVEEFKKLILRAYGEKSEDGKRFIKTDEVREQFSQTAAFEQIFIELCSDEGKVAEFIKGVMPKDLNGEIEKAIADQAATPTV